MQEFQEKTWKKSVEVQRPRLKPSTAPSLFQHGAQGGRWFKARQLPSPWTGGPKWSLNSAALGIVQGNYWPERHSPAQRPWVWQIQTENFQVPVSALPAQKCSVPSEPIPKHQANFGLCALLPYSSCHISFLTSTPFRSSLERERLSSG